MAYPDTLLRYTTAAVNRFWGVRQVMRAQVHFSLDRKVSGGDGCYGGGVGLRVSV